MIFGSAMMVTLSPLSFITFKKLVSCCDTPTNRVYLINFNEDCNRLKQSLDNVTKLYGTPEARRANIMLSRNKYGSEEEKKELEEILNNSELTVAEIQSVNGTNVKISKNAQVLLTYLLSREFTDKLDKFMSCIKISKNTSGVSVFGTRLHSLIHRTNESSIYYNISKTFNSKRFNKKDLEILEREVGVLSEYIKTKDDVSDSKVYSKLSDLIANLNDFVPTPDYLNDRIFSSNPLTVDEMYELSKELFKIGVVGFTPFAKDFFDEFSGNVSYVTGVDLSIVEGTPLFEVYQDLLECLNSYKAIKGGVYCER